MAAPPRAVLALPLALLAAIVLLPTTAALGGCASPVASPFGRITLLTVLGDSNSDAGSAAYSKRSFSNKTLNWPIATVYHEGRFSNGPIWTDFLNANCLQINGYAVGFGTQCTTNSVASKLLRGNPLARLFPNVVSVQEQADEYVKKDLKRNRLPATRGVYIWAAANDLSALFLADPKAPFGDVTALSDDVLRAVAACAGDTVRSLYAAGERNIILANLQPLEKTAFISNLVAYGFAVKALQTDTLTPRIAGYVSKFNAYLRDEVTALQQEFPLARIFHHNIHKALDSFLSGERPELGFTELRQACVNFESGAGFQSLNSSQVTGGPGAVAFRCSQPDTYADWDVNHFTTRAHKEVLAAEVERFLKSKGLLSSFAKC